MAKIIGGYSTSHVPAIGAAFPPVAMEIVRLRLTHAAGVELILGAELYDASELVRFGVVPHLTPAGNFDDTAGT